MVDSEPQSYQEQFVAFPFDERISQVNKILSGHHFQYFVPNILNESSTLISEESFIIAKSSDLQRNQNGEVEPVKKVVMQIKDDSKVQPVLSSVATVVYLQENIESWSATFSAMKHLAEVIVSGKGNPMDAFTSLIHNNIGLHDPFYAQQKINAFLNSIIFNPLEEHGTVMESDGSLALLKSSFPQLRLISRD